MAIFLVQENSIVDFFSSKSESLKDNLLKLMVVPGIYCMCAITC